MLRTVEKVRGQEVNVLLDLGMLMEEFPSSLFIPSSIFFLIAFRTCTSETEMEGVTERKREFRWESEMWRCWWRRRKERNRVNYIYKGAKKRAWDAEAI